MKKQPPKTKAKADDLYSLAVKQFLDGNIPEARKNVKAALAVCSTHAAAKQLKRRLFDTQSLRSPTRTTLADGTIVTTSIHGVLVYKSADGRFLPGQSTNPNGGSSSAGLPKRSQRSIDHLVDAIEYVEKSKKKNLYVHFVETAFKNPMVLVAIFRKLLPDLKAVEALVGAVGTMTPEEAQAIKAELADRFEKFCQQRGGSESRKLLEHEDECPTDNV